MCFTFSELFFETECGSKAVGHLHKRHDVWRKEFCIISNVGITSESHDSLVKFYTM